jgi:hypothetical protein
MKNIDLAKINNIEFAGIDNKDYPDYVDSYISSAAIEITLQEYNLCQGSNQVAINGKYFRDLTDTELEYIQDNHEDWFYDRLMNYLH